VITCAGQGQKPAVTPNGTFDYQEWGEPMGNKDKLAQQILEDALADFCEKKLGADALTDEYMGVPISLLEQKYLPGRGYSKVDLELALKALEENEMIGTGPTEAYDNDPDDTVIIIGVRSKRKFIYLTENGYKTANRPSTKKSLVLTYRRMSFMSKLAFWGSVASIAGLIATLYPTQKAQSENQNTYGDLSPAIGTVGGNVTINNYGGTSSTESRRKKHYVLRNSGGGSVLVLKKPDLGTFNDASNQVCTVISGTPIALTGEVSRQQGVELWQKVKINEGPCAGKTGWVVTHNISFE
jgi:hypothetical protein